MAAKKAAQTRRLPHGIKKQLEKMRRRHWHPIIHHVRKKYRISRKTIFYMKEYGPRSHVSHVIVKESIRILILASLISSLGGVGIQAIQQSILAIVPLLIMLPALNDMIGDFGTIVSSKFATMLFTGRIKCIHWQHSRDLWKLLRMTLAVAILSSVYLGTAATWLAMAKGFAVTPALFAKVLQIALFSTVALVSLISITSILAGLYIFSKNEDPNNFLIPIATSVADLGSMAVFAAMVALLF